MASDRQLSRISLRKDQILQVQFGPWNDPPPEMAKLPGVNPWWNEMKLARERDIATIERMLNNITQAATTTSPTTPAATESLTGETGPIGPRGFTGPQGLQGPPGPAGSGSGSGTGDEVLTWLNL